MSDLTIPALPAPAAVPARDSGSAARAHGSFQDALAVALGPADAARPAAQAGERPGSSAEDAADQEAEPGTEPQADSDPLRTALALTALADAARTTPAPTGLPPGAATDGVAPGAPAIDAVESRPAMPAMVGTVGTPGLPSLPGEGEAAAVPQGTEGAGDGLPGSAPAAATRPGAAPGGAAPPMPSAGVDAAPGIIAAGGDPPGLAGRVTDDPVATAPAAPEPQAAVSSGGAVHALAGPAGRPADAAPAGVDAAAGQAHGDALAARVEAAVASLEQAPPPRRVVLELSDLGNLQLAVSLRGGQVHVQVLGERAAAAAPAWLGDLERALAERGLDLAGRGGAGHPGARQGRGGDPDPSGAAGHARWPADRSVTHPRGAGRAPRLARRGPDQLGGQLL